MNKLLKPIFTIAIISSILGLMVGCSGTKTTASSTNTATTSAALNQATITIGIDTAMTGAAAAGGLSQVHGVTLAFDDANAAGGLTIGDTHYTFKVVALDDKFDTATSTNNITQLVDSDGAKFIFTFQIGGILATNALLTQNHVLNFGIVTDDSAITQPADAYTFRMYMPTGMQINPIFQWVIQQHPNVKTVAFIGTDDDSGQVSENLVSSAATANGLTDVGAVLYDAGTTNFSPFVTKILAEKPDFIVCTEGAVGDAAVIFKTLNQMGYTGVILAGTFGDSSMLPIAGEAALEGVIDTDMAMQAPTVTAAGLALPAREVAEWGTAYPDTWDFYNQATLMYQAMKRANSVDPEVVKNLLQDGTQTWSDAVITGGIMTFNSTEAQALYGKDATNQVTEPYTLCVIHDGKDQIATVIEPSIPNQ